MKYVNGMEAIINSDDMIDRKKLAEKEGIPLDCMWNITVKEGWKVKYNLHPIAVHSVVQ